MWGSIKTDRELSLLPSDELKIIFKIILSFLEWQWKNHVTLAVLRSSQESQALSWGPHPWGGMGAVPIATCPAGTQAPLQTAGLAPGQCPGSGNRAPWRAQLHGGTAERAALTQH